MGDERSGLVAALEMLDPREPPADEQSELFEAAGSLSIPARAQAVSKSGGRPKGAINKSTDAWREYLLSRYRSPLVALLEMCNRTPTELANDLELKKTLMKGKGDWRYEEQLADVQAAAAMQMDAHKALLPYLHQKAPTSIELPDNTDAPLLVIGNLNVGNGGVSGVQPPLEKTVENQQVIDVTPEKSDGEKSDAT